MLAPLPPIPIIDARRGGAPEIAQPAHCPIAGSALWVDGWKRAGRVAAARTLSPQE